MKFVKNFCSSLLAVGLAILPSVSIGKTISSNIDPYSNSEVDVILKASASDKVYLSYSSALANGKFEEYHYSHQSHGSHQSHASHRSHYSSY